LGRGFSQRKGKESKKGPKELGGIESGAIRHNKKTAEIRSRYPKKIRSGPDQSFCEAQLAKEESDVNMKDGSCKGIYIGELKKRYICQ